MIMKRKFLLFSIAGIILLSSLLLKLFVVDASPYPFFPFSKYNTSAPNDKTSIPPAKQPVQVDSVKYPAPKLSVMGYYAEDWPGDMRALQDLTSHSGTIDAVAPFSYTVSEDGRLSGMPTSALTFAKQNGLQAYALIHNLQDNQINVDVVHKIVSDSSLRTTLAHNIEQMVATNGFQGVQFDLEGVMPSDRADLTALIQETASLLHANGYKISVALPAKTVDSPNDHWSGAYDYTAIGNVADFVTIMTYDEHWAGDTAGPVASYPWVQQVITFATTQIPPGKIFLGVAAYGYNWSAGSPAKVVMEKSMNQLAINHGVTLTWDEQKKESHFTYFENGVEHTVWGENPAGLDFKMQLAVHNHLKGIAIWRLGYTDDAFWDVISAYR
jgi:spore germination protein